MKKIKFTVEDEKFIDEAINVSKHEKQPYGAIIVKDGEIIGRSTDIPKIRVRNEYNHAEYGAIQSAIKSGKLGDITGPFHGGMQDCTLYISCQPSMIGEAMALYKNIKKIVYAATLEDSCKYMGVEPVFNAHKLAKLANINVEIIGELHREKAVEVFKDFANKK